MKIRKKTGVRLLKRDGIWLPFVAGAACLGFYQNFTLSPKGEVRISVRPQSVRDFSRMRKLLQFY